MAICAYDFPQLMWLFAFAFLIPVIYILDTSHISTRKISLYFFISTFFTIFFSTYWFIETLPLTWIKIDNTYIGLIIMSVVWILFSLFCSLPFLLIGVAKKYSHSRYFVYILASFWVTAEYMRSWVLAIGIQGKETLFGPHHTYYSLGYLVPHIPVFKYILSIGGLYLASFIIICINYILYSLYKNGTHSLKNKSLTILIGGILCLCVFSIGVSRYSEKFDTEKSDVSITVFNTNKPATTDENIALEKEQEIVKHVAYGQIKNSDIVVMPENFSILEDVNTLVRPQMKGGAVLIGSYSGAHFYNMYFAENRPQDTEMGISTYQKQLLMPIGEYNLSVVDFIVSHMNSSWQEQSKFLNHSTQKGNNSGIYVSHSNKNVRISGTMCSEDISPILYRNGAKQGADLFVNIASHTPFHGSHLLSRQILAINTVRAIENGRFFVRASNADKSYIINNRGETEFITKDVLASKTTIHTQTVVLYTYKTPYTRYGDYMAILSLLFSILTFLWIPTKENNLQKTI